MKLEEVLPAMRKGLIAIHSETMYAIMKDGALMYCPVGRKEWHPACAMVLAEALDDWTLTTLRNPWKEWPKGSFQWALCNAGGGGMIRREGWPDVVAHFAVGRRGTVDVDELFYCDWKVVS